MPSYRYLREIEPENQPDEKKEYTKKEKFSNWWHYHWGWVAGGIAAVVLIITLVYPVFAQTKADLTVGVITPGAFPDGLVETLQDSLAPLVGDRNGDGKTVVIVETFVIYTEEELTSSQGGVVDPNLQMAGIVRLTGALSGGEPVLFLVDSAGLPEYQERFGLIGNIDGTSLPEGSEGWKDASVLWADSPTLSGLAMAFPLLDGQTIDAQPIMGNFRLALRPFEGTTLDNNKQGPATWQNAKDIFLLLAQ